MKKAFKKGFTLVELLVVIAILAILATVSIVGYTSFIDKANKSVDEQSVAQMNKVLLADGILENPPVDINDVREVLINNGYNGAFETAYAGYTFAWVESENVVVLVDTKNNTIVYPEQYTEGTYAYEKLVPGLASVEDVQNALTNVTNGDVIQVGQDMVLVGEGTVFKTAAAYEINLNKNKLSSFATSTEEKGFNINGGNVTISNGAIDTGDGKYGFFVDGTDGNITTATLTNVSIVGGNSEQNSIAFVSDVFCDVTLNDSQIYAVANAAPLQNCGGTLTLNNVTIAQSGIAELEYYNSAIQVVNAYYLSDPSKGQANTTVNSGTYTGKIAIMIDAPGGNITINGGTFTGTEYALKGDFLPNNYNVVDKLTSIIKINGGTFTGKIKISADTNLVITGGTFNNTGLTEEVFLQYVATGSTVVFEGKTITK